MSKYLERSAYKKLLEWKNRTNHATLEVSGARQVDEIQESSDIYNRVREFTRDLKSDFIITGSYLGRISHGIG